VGITPTGRGMERDGFNHVLEFSKQRKKFWLFPILFVMVIFGD